MVDIIDKTLPQQGNTEKKLNKLHILINLFIPGHCKISKLYKQIQLFFLGDILLSLKFKSFIYLLMQIHST